jgi:uracil-DNA glycosylase family 4
VSYNLQEIKNILELHLDLGVDELFSSNPESLFEKTKGSIVVRRRKKDQEPEYKAPSSPLLLKTAQVVEEANKLSQGIKTLEELRLAIESFQGSDLKKMATNLVFGDGNPKANIMIIGEAPGAEEDEQGLPFVGRSGQLLETMFATIGLSRKTDLYITNIIPYRPPGNRTPTAPEMSMFRPFILKHIELISPDFVILVGATSLKAIMNKDIQIATSHGNWLDLEIGGKKIQAMPIYHPAYVLRSPLQKRVVWQDLLKMQEKISQSQAGLKFGR